MKYLFTIGLTIFFFTSYSQLSDSTDIKLVHYKEMFIKGLISNQEYEKLKTQLLKPASNKPIESFEHLVAKEKKFRRAGIAFLSTGGVVSFIGIDLIGTAYSMKHNESTLPAYQTSTKQINNMVYSGIMLILTSMNFWTMGTIEMSIANHYKRKMSDKKVSLNIEPSVINGPHPITGIQATLAF